MWQLVIFGVLTIMSVLATRKTRDWFNPVNIIIISFFAPLIMSTLRLSELQGSSWCHETHLIFGQCSLIWLILPFICLLMYSKNKIAGFEYQIKVKKFASLNQISILIAIVYIITYLLENFYGLGSLLPAVRGNEVLFAEQGYKIAMPVANIITRNGFVPIMLLVMSLHAPPKTVKGLLVIACLIVPFTRLARLEFFVNVVVLVIAVYYWARNYVTYRTILGSALVGLCLLVLFGFVSNYRLTYGYRHEIVYGDLIKYNGYRGPFDLCSYYYGYFALSFENFDRFIRNNIDKCEHTFGLFLLSPIINVLQLDEMISEYPSYQYVVAVRDSVSSAATVTTALAEFWLDFGTYFIWLPLLLIMVIYLYIYLNQAKSFFLHVGYILMSYCFALSSFINLFVDARIIYGLLMMYVLITISQYEYRIRV